MKFEHARLSLSPRSTANCFDLAVWFCGRHVGPVIGLWAIFAVPLATVVYYTAWHSAWGFPAALGAWFLGTGPFGVMLAGGAARSAFGEELSLRKMLSDLKTDWPLVVRVLALRVPIILGFAVCLIPGALLAVSTGFWAESRILSPLHQQRHDRRSGELVKLEFVDLAVRAFLLLCAGFVLWMIWELTADVAWTILFGRSLFFGRLHELGNVFTDEVEVNTYVEHLWRLATSDPAVLVLHLTTGLAAYAVCRLAWFFCYIDLRVRRDCWDLELEMLDESQRLDHAR